MVLMVSHPACFLAPSTLQSKISPTSNHGRVVKGRQSLLTGDPQGRGVESERGCAWLRSQVWLLATAHELVSLITPLEKGALLSFFISFKVSPEHRCHAKAVAYCLMYGKAPHGGHAATLSKELGCGVA